MNPTRPQKIPLDDPITVRILPEPITSQLVPLAITIAGTVALIWLKRKMSGPDAFLTIKMKGLVTIQDYADKRARFWHDVSAKASAEYLASRL
jgi:hypothetical protein